MNKLTVMCCFALLTCGVQITSAQTSVNKLSSFSSDETSSPSFISGISFTPDGILKTIETGGIIDLKSEEVPRAENEAAENESSSSIEKLSTLQFKYAMMLKVDVESLKNLSLLSFIEDWFGTRYRLGGTTKRGIDCSALTGGLLLAVYGLALPRTAKEQYEATDHIEKEDLKEGDLVFFNTHGGVSHVGLYLENHFFIHASSSQGVTISNLDDAYYAKRFICGGRLEE